MTEIKTNSNLSTDKERIDYLIANGINPNELEVLLITCNGSFYYRRVGEQWISYS